IDQKNLRLKMRCDRESKPHIHSARITLHRSIEEFFDLGEGDDLIEFFLNFGACHSEDRAVEKNIFPAGQLRMKTGSNFKKSADPAVNIRAATRRLGDPIQDFEQRAFARAVGPDNSNYFALPHIERNILQSPECF